MRRVLRSAGFWCAVVLLASAARADAPVDAAQRIEEIREQSRALDALAREPLPEVLEGKERRSAEAYQKWLEKTSLELAAFADRWEEARRREQTGTGERSADATTSKIDSRMKARRPTRTKDEVFELQVARLQERMNQQNQAFQMISSIMKAQQDAAKSIIQNMR